MPAAARVRALLLLLPIAAASCSSLASAAASHSLAGAVRISTRELASLSRSVSEQLCS